MKTRIYNGLYFGFAVLSILLFGSNLGASPVIVTPTLTSFNAVSNTGVWGFTLTNLTGSPITQLPGGNTIFIFQNTSFSGNILPVNFLSAASAQLQIKSPRINTALSCVNGQARSTNALWNYTLDCPPAVSYNAVVVGKNTSQLISNTPISNVTLSVRINATPACGDISVNPSWTTNTLIRNSTCLGENVAVNAIKPLGIKGTFGYPGNYVNTTYGINLSTKVDVIDKNLHVPLGGCYNDPLRNFSICTISASQVAQNKSSMEAIWNATASVGCAPGALVSFYDNNTHRTESTCTRLNGALAPSAWVETGWFANSTNGSLDVGLGQGTQTLLAACQTGVKGWKDNATAYSAQATNYSGQLYTCKTNQNDILQIVQGVAEFMIAAGLIIYLGMKYARRTKSPAPAGRR